MDRKDEIQILIAYLEKDTIGTAGYPAILADTIIKNGKLIEAYHIELQGLVKT